MRIWKNIFVLALNGFQEVIRHRFFYGLALVAVLILSVGAILGPLSMSEEKRITVNFSLFATQIVLIAASIFFGSLSITRDMEKKIITTLITRPISRAQYILGKFFGMAFVMIVAVILLGCILSVIFYYFQIPIQSVFIKSLWGIYLEALVLLSISILFSSFTSNFLIICYTVCFFIIGHWIDTMKTLLQKTEEPFLKFISEYGVLAFPNLERFNWRSHVVYQDLVPLTEVIFYSFYAVSWVLLFLVIAIHIFNRKDFV